jgi:hypothetical protein
MGTEGFAIKPRHKNTFGTKLQTTYSKVEMEPGVAQALESQTSTRHSNFSFHPNLSHQPVNLSGLEAAIAIEYGNIPDEQEREVVILNA